MNGPRIALLAALLSLASITAVAAAPGGFEGRAAWADPRGVQVPERELAFADPETPHFRNEALYVAGRLDNGWVFTTGFFGWRLGPFRGYGVYALLGEPGGASHWMLRQLRRDDVEMSDTALAVRGDGFRFERSGDRLVAEATGGGIELALALDSILPPWRPGEGVAHPTTDPGIYSRVALPAPWASVSGWVAVGGERVAVTGQGYSDLTLTVVPSQRLPVETSCFRVWSAPGAPPEERWFLSVIEYVAHPSLGSTRQPILILARGTDWVLTTPELSLDRAEPTAGPFGDYPARLVLSSRDQGWSLEGEYRASTLYETTDMFAEIPAALRGIVGLFARRSLNYRTIGTFRGTLTAPDGRRSALELSGFGEQLVVR